MSVEHQDGPRQTPVEWNRLRAALRSPRKPAAPVSAEKFYEIVPRLGAEALQLARVPRPPQIPPGSITNVHASHCAMWLKAWVQLNYGESISFNRRTNFTKRRNWKALHDGIAVLRQHHISAARWIAFVVQMPVVTDAVRAPAFSTLFSRGIVNSQVDFCRRASTELGGRVVMPEKAKQLAHDHSMMLQDLRLRRATTPEEIRAGVAKYFPGGSFKTRVAMVAAASTAEQTRMDKALEDVEWIW